MTALPAITRPDGRLYRPRKLVACQVDEDGDFAAVLVLGTHDTALAWPLADQFAAREAGSGYRAYDPMPGWWREALRGGERCWVDDEKRGRAGVLFGRVAEAEEEGAGHAR